MCISVTNSTWNGDSMTENILAQKLGASHIYDINNNSESEILDAVNSLRGQGYKISTIRNYVTVDVTVIVYAKP